MSEVKTRMIDKIRGDFPLLGRSVRGKPLVYLDNAASTLKPIHVIDRITQYYREESSNVHRGAHYLSEQGTIAYESARETVREFIGAAQASEVVFTRGTTESINLVAQSFGRQFLQAGDEIILSELEHHSNIVPWQMMANERGAKIKVAPVTDQGEIDFKRFTELLSKKTKIVALAWCSNALGTITDVARFIQAAHDAGAKVLLDAAQSVAQMPTDVQALNCDFLAFSGHKVFGPYGIGVLYGKGELLEQMPPYQGGGSMISQVTWEKTTWASVPHKFEAGTPAIADALGLAEALKYVRDLGFDWIQNHERDLLKYATETLNSIEGLRIIGEAKHKAPIVSFIMDGAHPSDVGALVDQQGVAVRAGHHCCQPLMLRFGIPATTRASFSIYNTRQEVDMLKQSLIKAKEFF